MATRGDGNRSALLVIDVQNGVVANSWKRDEVVHNVAAMVEHARASDVPVIWIQHEADDLPRDSDAWQMVPELVPAEHECISTRSTAIRSPQPTFRRCWTSLVSGTW